MDISVIHTINPENHTHFKTTWKFAIQISQHHKYLLISLLTFMYVIVWVM